MKTLYKWMAVVAVTALIAACAVTANYNSYTIDDDLNANTFDTYAVLPNGDAPSSTYNVDALKKKLADEVVDEMNQRTYTMNSEDPDVLVHIHTMFEEKSKVDKEPVYGTYAYYYPNFTAGPWYPYYYTGYTNVTQVMGYDYDTISYTEASIIIDVIDAETNNIMWRGWSEDRATYNDLIANAAIYIENIFDEYPVKEAYSQR